MSSDAAGVPALQPRLPGPLRAAGPCLAWGVTVAWIVAGLWPRGPGVTAAAVAGFTLYLVASALRMRRAGIDPGASPAVLVFLAPAVPVALLLPETLAGRPALGLSEFLPAAAGLVVAHVLLLRGQWAGGFPARLVPATLLGWTAAVWLASTALQLLRFHLLLPAGSPEDTAYLWDCFRSWSRGGSLVSSWSAAWGHEGLRHYFGLHFSPVLPLVFAAVRLLPRVETLLLVQNVVLGIGLLLWARVLGPCLGGGTDRTAPAVWTLALLAAFPPLQASLRQELHPLLWSLPLLAALHGSYVRRRPAAFLAAGLALFLFREDLGFVWGGYAVVSWLEGRRREGRGFWLLAPLLGPAGTLALMALVMPHYGRPGVGFFQAVFGTSVAGLLPFVLWLLAEPAEAARRLLRPAHLALALRLAGTGMAVPFRSAWWIPGVPLAVLFALSAPGRVLLTPEAHYLVIPALFLFAGGWASMAGVLGRWRPRRRDAALVLLWALCLVQTAAWHLPPPALLLHPLRHRAEVLRDLEALGRAGPVWVPVELLLATSPPSAVPLHRFLVGRLDPADPRTPRAALLPAGGGEAPERAWLEERYRLHGPVRRGRHYDLYRLEPPSPGAAVPPSPSQ